MSNRDWLKSRLTEERFLHSLAVERRAARLARLHGENESKAALAGLLHDCCKDMPPDRQLKIIQARGILLDKITLAQPQLWHAIAGSIAIQDGLGIHDGEIIDAIRFHTAGAKGMSRLSQIVYLADLTGEDRRYPDIEYYRGLAEQSLERAMLECLAFIVGKLVSEGRPVAADTFEAYNQFWIMNQIC